MRAFAAAVMAASLAVLGGFGGADAKVSIPGSPFETDCLNLVLEHRKELPGQFHTPSCDVIVSMLLWPSKGQRLSEQDRLGLLLSLHHRGWIAEDAAFNPDPLWQNLALSLLQTHQDQEALAVVHDIADPYDVIEMRVDNDEAALVRLDPTWFEPREAMARSLEQLRARAAAEPDRVVWLVVIALTLSQAGDDAQALSVLDDALSRDASHAKPGFSDMDQLRRAVLATRGYALYGLGRTDEAIASMTLAVRWREDFHDNAPAKLVLAGFYDLLGRPADALAAISDVQLGAVSAHDAMARAEARAAAYAQLGDRNGLDKAMAYGREHAAASVKLYQRMLLDADDEDGAAAEYIARLQDPLQRQSALAELQDWRPPPGVAPFAVEIERRRLKVRGRPDVQAAIARVGRIERFDLTPPN